MSQTFFLTREKSYLVSRDDAPAWSPLVQIIATEIEEEAGGVDQFSAQSWNFVEFNQLSHPTIPYFPRNPGSFI